jgi:hypothetical protein
LDGDTVRPNLLQVVEEPAATPGMLGARKEAVTAFWFFLLKGTAWFVAPMLWLLI